MSVECSQIQKQDTPRWRNWRLAKWADELGGHNILYRPRPAIKGQVLADFIREVTAEKVKDCEIVEAPIKDTSDGLWFLYTDGASNEDGSGAGLRLVSPEKHEFTYAIRLDFKNTNNEAEYEAFLAGLRLAIKMGAKNLQAHVDSLLIASQVNGFYDAKCDVMALYLDQAKELLQKFKKYRVVHINRYENKQADALSKLASTFFQHLAKEVRIEVLKNPSVLLRQVNVIEMGQPSWMTPIIRYLQEGILPENKAEARKIQHKALHYEMNDGILYRRSFLGPLLRCVDPQDANYLIREIHEGICGIHAGPRMVVAKIMSAGYYWPGMHVDALKELRKCDSCQRHSPKTLRPKNDLIPVSTAWPFQQWGIDMVGPFPDAPGAVKFIIVAVDYFTKWVEAKALASTTAMMVRKFIWEHIICRFGLLLKIVTDNGNNFASEDLKKWMKEMKIEHAFSSVAHPQGNGQVESVNKSIVEGITSRLGETPFSLVYGSEAVIPAEVGLPSPRLTAVNTVDNEAERRLDLDLLEERREIARIKEAKYKTQLERYYNARVRICTFTPGEYVFRDNEASNAERPGKLTPKWEGPYLVHEVLGKGPTNCERWMATSSRARGTRNNCADVICNYPEAMCHFSHSGHAST
ncbi:uncharacterized protein LOC110902081 [Helianthus annuus]|uniref:uncharacterized protein LOC110902081 n=1 Tax=Helianthus annuus TaxID=4232 RepID=UPI000B8F5E55|nr:uncharacterized protein LOC110902081 [Helianthus annuus]